MSKGLLSGLKQASFPIWTRVPGTPFSLPGRIDIQERLPGMEDWVSRKRIEEIARALEEGQTTPQIVHDQGMSGLGGSAALGGGAGLTAGALGARLAGGEEAYGPLKKILREGVNSGTIRGLGDLSRFSRFAPLAGLGLGAAAGTAMWSKGVPQRRQESREVVRGLLAERILQRNALREAIKSNKPYTQSILSGIPVESASASPPHVVIPGNVGV